LTGNEKKKEPCAGAGKLKAFGSGMQVFRVQGLGLGLRV